MEKTIVANFLRVDNISIQSFKVLKVCAKLFTFLFRNILQFFKNSVN